MSPHAIWNGDRDGCADGVVGVVGEGGVRCRVSIPNRPLTFLRGLLAHLRRGLWPGSGKAQGDCGEQRRRQLEGQVQAEYKVLAKQSKAAVKHTSSCLAFCLRILRHDSGISLSRLLMGIQPYNILNHHSNSQNFPNDLVAALFFDTRNTLNRTVFDNGRHWPAHVHQSATSSCKHTTTTRTTHQQ